MIIFKKSLNRYYDTKAKKIVSKKYAKQWAINHGKYYVAHNDSKAIKDYYQHNGRGVRRTPSYKKMYLHAVKQLKALENQYSVGKWHPFIANQTKHGYVSPATNVRDVKEFLHDHGGKLFVVAALGNDDHSIVEACGSVDDYTAAGFGARELVPDMVEKFEQGYND